jgi:hypothetical protein
MPTMCTRAQRKPLRRLQTGGFHSRVGARDDWPHRHGGARARWMVERPISVDRDDVGNSNADSWALDVNQEWCVPSFPGNRSGC